MSSKEKDRVTNREKGLNWGSPEKLNWGYWVLATQPNPKKSKVKQKETHLAQETKYWS